MIYFLHSMILITIVLFDNYVSFVSTALKISIIVKETYCWSVIFELQNKVAEWNTS